MVLGKLLEHAHIAIAVSLDKLRRWSFSSIVFLRWVTSCLPPRCRSTQIISALRPRAASAAACGFVVC